MPALAKPWPRLLHCQGETPTFHILRLALNLTHLLHRGLLHFKWPRCFQIVSSSGLRRTLQSMNPKDTLTPVHLPRKVAITLMSFRRKTLGIVAKVREARAGHLTTLHVRPRVNSPIHDNYCVNAPVYAGLLTGSKETVNVFKSKF